jgi:hypothetical protein
MKNVQGEMALASHDSKTILKPRGIPAPRGIPKPKVFDSKTPLEELLSGAQPTSDIKHATTQLDIASTSASGSNDDDMATFQTMDDIPDPATIDAKTTDVRLRALLKLQKWRFTPMYKDNINGKPMLWWIGFDATTEEMLMTHGHVNGAIRTDRTKIEMNQSGRSIHVQSLLAIRHKYLIKHRNEGYRPPGEAPPDVCKPMLADKWEPEKTRLRYPVIVQPKLDGMRCLSRRVGLVIVYRSRGNRKFPHFNEEFDEELSVFLSYIPYSVELDGEMYMHGESFSTQTTVFKNENKKHPKLKEMPYYIYDFISAEPLPYEKRHHILSKAMERCLADGHKMVRVKLLYTATATSKDNIFEWHSYFRSQKFEGTMIRKLAGEDPTDSQLKESLYKPGRGKNLLKFKDIESEEGVVIGVEEAKGTEAGAALLKVRTPHNDTRTGEPAIVTMRSKNYTVETRREWMQHPELVVGRLVTFEYQELSIYGLPRFPVMVAFRDYE